MFAGGSCDTSTINVIAGNEPTLDISTFTIEEDEVEKTKEPLYRFWSAKKQILFLYSKRRRICN
jgi:hypothetical protein